MRFVKRANFRVRESSPLTLGVTEEQATFKNDHTPTVRVGHSRPARLFGDQDVPGDWIEHGR
jgi:hypothetical protein